MRSASSSRDVKEVAKNTDAVAGRTVTVTVGLYTVINKVVIGQRRISYKSSNCPWKNNKA